MRRRFGAVETTASQLRLRVLFETKYLEGRAGPREDIVDKHGHADHACNCTVAGWHWQNLSKCKPLPRLGAKTEKGHALATSVKQIGGNTQVDLNTYCIWVALMVVEWQVAGAGACSSERLKSGILRQENLSTTKVQ